MELSNQLIRVARAEIDRLATVAWPVGALVIASDDLLTETEYREIVLARDRGCRMFICLGRSAESNHDRLDDYLLEQPLDDVAMTTFHRDDQPLEDVASMLVVYMRDQRDSAIVIVNITHELTEGLIAQIEAVAAG